MQDRAGFFKGERARSKVTTPSTLSTPSTPRNDGVDGVDKVDELRKSPTERGMVYGLMIGHKFPGGTMHETPSSWLARLAVIGSLVLLTVAAYWQVGGHEFLTNYDDELYVTGNEHVLAGLTLEGVTWAFTTGFAANWHPMTWLSHMADIALFGPDPGRHHLMNLALHVVNAVLLFLVFERMTGGLWRSAFVAALFALHPLHVESVAWISERKDVLSTLFWLLAMAAYVRYAKSGSVRSYILVMALFALGLMSKPMVVTLPCVLLLLDCWPLGRVNGQVRCYARLAIEKAPLFALTLLSCAITCLVQHQGGAMPSLASRPLGARFANAIAAYGAYLWKTAWPATLPAIYPLPATGRPLWQAAVSGLLLAGVTVLVLKQWRAKPYLPVGWLWFLGTLVPVIGIVQVGDMAMANRYSYVPLIGVFVMIAWGVPDLMRRVEWGRTAMAALSGGVIVLLTACTWVHAGYWRDGKTIFRYTLSVTSHNAVARNNLGKYLMERGGYREAEYQFNEARRIRPRFDLPWYNLGLTYARQDRLEEAARCFAGALERRPGDAATLNNLGMALAGVGKVDEAIGHYRDVLRAEPGNVDVRMNLGAALARLGRYEEAVAQFGQATALAPGNPGAHFNRALALERLGRAEEAVAEYERALELGPDSEAAQRQIDGLREWGVD